KGKKQPRFRNTKKLRAWCAERTRERVKRKEREKLEREIYQERRALAGAFKRLPFLKYFWQWDWYARKNKEPLDVDGFRHGYEGVLRSIIAECAGIDWL